MLALSAGWDFWGASYGVHSVTGPEVYLRYQNARSGRIGYWLWAKAATLTDSTDLLSSGNGELAAGLGIELTRDRRPWALIFDGARASSTITNGRNSMTETRAALGVQKSL